MKREFARLARAFGYAGQGLAYLFRSQRNARIHAFVTAVALAAAVWLQLTATQWAVLALTIGFVLAAEALNTAVEAVVDRASPEHHPLAKIAKDTAAGGVLIAAITAVTVAAFLFLPALFKHLGR